MNEERDAALETEENLGDYLLDDGETEARSPESETEQPEAAQTETQPEPKPEPEVFQIRIGAETREISRGDLNELALRGMEYDRTRAELDSLSEEARELRQFREENTAAAEFIQEMARDSGMSAAELMDSIRTSRYAQQFERQGLGKSAAQTAARERLGREKAEKAARILQDGPTPSGNTNPQAVEDAAAKRRGEDIRSFLVRFPGVKPDEIPKEVWAEVSRGKRLSDAFGEWRQQQEVVSLRQENERLKQELSAGKQNAKNQRTSLGSQSSAAGESGKDAFLAALLSDD